MAKIKVAGKAVVITSSLKYEDIKTIEKYRKNALTLRDEKDEPVFRIGTTNGTGKINAYGAEFDGCTRDNDKLATITILADIDDSDDAKEFIADTVGAWVLTLNKLEKELPKVLEEIKAEKAEILSNIEIG